MSEETLNFTSNTTQQESPKSNTDVISAAGDVILSDVILTNIASGVVYNITPQVLAINIYESLNNVFVQGDICIQDTQNLTNLFPLTGNEVINFSFRTPGHEEYVKNFVVVGISEKAKRERESVYVLSLISAEAVIDRNTRISKKFSGSAGQIVADLLKYYKCDILEKDVTIDNSVIEDSINKISFISNWWSPSKCIKYVQDRAIDVYDKPSFVFFENRLGFHFLSTQTIINNLGVQGPYAYFRQDDLHRTTNNTANSTAYKNLEDDYRRLIGTARYLTEYDYFKRLKEGFYGSEVVGYDITSGQYIHNKYDNLAYYSTMNVNKPLANIHFGSTAGKMNTIYKNSCNLDNDLEVMNHRHGTMHDYSNMKQIMSRSTLMSRLNNSGKLVIEVYGKSDYSVGQIVNVMIPKDQQILKNEDPWDYLISGNYMVYELKHSISVGARCTHTCTMNLCKDSYQLDCNSTIQSVG